MDFSPKSDSADFPLSTLSAVYIWIRDICYAPDTPDICYFLHRQISWFQTFTPKALKNAIKRKHKNAFDKLKYAIFGSQ